MRLNLKSASAATATAVAALILAACADGGNGGAGSDKAGTPQVPVTETRAGTQQHMVIPSPVDEADVSFEVFEPDQLVAGASYPLVLHGHGYGGTRQRTRDGFVGRLTAAGYYVISIDERGFGESGGTVRVMSPDFEGQDLIAILDWAEALPGLARRKDGSMVVGSYGGSYGGMYQGLLAAADPKHRLRVLAPDITPHDLTYSLQPNGVVKSGYGLALAGVGESGAQNNQANPNPMDGQDPFIFETLVQSTLLNAFSDASFNLFRYHSYKYFCDAEPAGAQEFVVATPDPMAVPPSQFVNVDALVTQGFRDTLFNVNEGLANYDCLKARGGDVRLLTHQSGHILPVSLTSVPGAEAGLDPFYEAVTMPNFQDAGGSRSCGSMDLNDVQFAWFEEKLHGQKGALDAALKSGSNVCLSLAEGDAVAVAEMKRGGTDYAIGAQTPQFNSVLGVGGAALGNGAREQLLATIPLETPAEGGIIAGVPTLSLEFAGLSGMESEDCAVPLNVGACDPIVLLAIGWQKAGTTRWDVIDDQLTPVRGFGTHRMDMSAIAERLAPGDKLALLVYGFHAQFPVTWSRDVFVPALEVSGTVSLPLLAPGEVVREGI